MTRYFRIFFLHFQHVFEQRSKSFVWFLVTLINPFVLFIYWQGVFKSNEIKGWSLTSVSTYFFLIIVAGVLLMSHIDEAVSEEDIAEGRLVIYIIRPFSYFWYNFIRELPYRILQGSFAVLSILIFFLLFGNFFRASLIPESLFLTILVFFLAYLLSYTFKIVLGLSAFWLIDIRGFFSFIEIILLILAGYLLPLEMMPVWLRRFADFTPFPYMIYYPIMIFQGNLTLLAILKVLFIQIVWIGAFALLYKILWYKGLKKFTGMGQ